MIYRLDGDSGEGEVYAMDQLLGDDFNVGLALNGIAVTPDEGYLIVGEVVPGRLYRVSLSDSSDIMQIALTGDDMVFADGLVFSGDDLYVMGIVTGASRVLFDTDFSSGNVVQRDQIPQITNATLAEGNVYVIKSEILKAGTTNPPELPFEIFRLDTAAYDE